MILPDWQIRELLAGLSPVAYVPYDRQGDYDMISDSQIQPASLDVRLLGEFRSYFAEQTLTMRPGASLVLDPGECILGCLVERFRIPANMVAEVKGKSSWARRFLTTHAAGWIDPGFQGDITLELKNDGTEPLQIRAGEVIAQVSFHRLAAPAERLYGRHELKSHYQGQEGPTASAL